MPEPDTSTHLLTDEDLKELSGWARPRDQIQWLRRHGIGFVVRRDGRPRTTWEEVNLALHHRQSAGPDFSMFDNG